MAKAICFSKTSLAMELEMKLLSTYPVMLALSMSLLGGPCLEAKTKNHAVKIEKPKVKRTKAEIKKIKEKALQLKLTDPDGIPDAPQIAIDADGNAIAVYVVYAETGYIIKATTSASGGAWATPVAISDTDVYAGNPTLVMNEATGVAVAVWESEDPMTGVASLQANRFSGSSWDGPEMLSTSDEIVFDNFKVDINTADEIIVTWNSFVMTSMDFEIFSAFCDEAGSWSSAQLVSQ